MKDHVGVRIDPRLRLSLRQLEVFVATARTGSTRGAAERVARSQSAASAALAELEVAIEGQLFDRVGRRLILNERGRALLPGAIALLEQAGELQGLFAAAHRAPLRVAASLTIGEYLLPQVIARWKDDHPDSPVALTIGNSSRVIQAVVDMEDDVGFIEGPQTHPDLHVRRWLEDELILVASPSHPLARRAATHRQLADAVWILREPASGTRQAADAWLLEHLGALQVQYELGSTEAIKRLAAAGVGLACVSRHAVAVELAQGALAEVRTRLPRSRRRLAIAVRRDRRLGRATEDFVRHCTG
jgi:DNA-binding transcriptional LysR family regulator